MDEKYDAQGDHKLNTSNIQALEFIIASGGSRISVVGMYHNSGSTPLEEGNSSFFLLCLLSLRANFSYRGILNGFAKQPRKSLLGIKLLK